MPCYQGGTYRKEHLDYWTEQNHDASTPRLSYKSSNNTYTSSFWMKSAAYLRLKNLQLGYDLPSKWMKAIGLKSAYIYANAENLLTFTDFWDLWVRQTIIPRRKPSLLALTSNSD